MAKGHPTPGALLDRAFYAAANFGQLFAGKPAAIAACWRAGPTPSIDRLNKHFTFSRMPVISSEYWNGYLGPRDRVGVNVLKTLAGNMARLLFCHRFVAAIAPILRYNEFALTPKKDLKRRTNEHEKNACTVSGPCDDPGSCGMRRGSEGGGGSCGGA